MPERQYEVQDNTDDINKILDRIETRGWTPTQEHFGSWITEKSGVEFSTNKERVAFTAGARYALALRYEHQRSPENHDAKEEARAAREQEVAAKPKRQPKVVEEEDEAPAPKRRGRPAKVVEEAPPAPARRGRRTAAAATSETETSAPAKPGRRPAARGGARRGANKAEADF